MSVKVTTPKKAAAEPVAEKSILSEEDRAEYEDTLARGKKEFLVNNFDEAVDLLSTATKHANTMYGEFGLEAWDAVYTYGRALARWAAEQSPLIAKTDIEDASDDDETADEAAAADKKADEKPTDDSKPAEEAKSTEASVEEPKAAEPAAADAEVADKADAKTDANAKSADKIAADDLKAVDESIAEETITEETAGDEVAASGDAPTGEVAEMSDYVSNAWQVLEVARKIADNTSGNGEIRKWTLRAADTNQALGELLLLDEECDQALVEFEKALDIKKKLLKPNDREIAETYFHIGKTYNMMTKFEEVAKPMELAIKILTENIDALKEGKDILDAAADDSKPVMGEEQRKTEIAELQSICKDIREHIDDAQQSAAATQSVKEQFKTMLSGVFKELADNKTNSEPINDVTSLLKRKRKVDETVDSKPVETDENDGAKKSKIV